MRLLALLLPVTFLAQAGTTVTNTLVATASNATGGPPHAWIDGGTQLAIAEDGAATVTLPFDVAPFGDSFGTATITSDGAILFGGALPAGCPSTAAAGSGVAVLVAPLNGARVTTRTVGSWPNRVFVVSWNDVGLDGGSATGRVQAWLLEGRSEVVIVHDDVAFAAGGTVRAGGWGGGMGVDWLCDVAPVSGRSAWIADRGVRPSRPAVTAEELPMPWYGDSALDGAGEVVAAGDLNGDDVADLAIGSPVLGAGEVTVVARPADGGRLDDVPVHVTHPTSGVRLGRALAFADLDADGLDELVVGAPQAESGAGVVYVWEDVLSSASHTPTTASAAWTGPSGSRFGGAFAVGDADGDGADDVLVGAPNFASGSNLLAGSAWLMLGGSGGGWRGPRTVATSAAFHLEGGSAGEGLGQSVLLVDLDADLDADAVFGAPFKDVGGQVRGAVNAWTLSPGAPGAVSGAPAWVVTGPVAGGRFGWSLAAGALTGGLAQDVVVGAPYANVSGANEGRVFVFADPGTSAGVPSPASSIGYETTQNRTSARLGQSLAVADIDVDGHDDLVVGAPNETTAANGAGVVYVLRDAVWSSVMYVDDADVAVEGVHGGALVGTSLAARPETDRTPLFVAAPGDSWGAENAGAVYTYTWRPDFVDDDGDGQVTADVGGPDCDDTDPAVFAGAIDLAGDGIDADCDGWRDGRVATRTTVSGWNHDVEALGGTPASFAAIGFEERANGDLVAASGDVQFSPSLAVDTVVYGALPEGLLGGKLALPPLGAGASLTLDFGVPTDGLALQVLDGLGPFTFSAGDGAGTTHVVWTQDLDAQDRPGGAFVGMNFSRPVCSVTVQASAIPGVRRAFGVDAIRYHDAATVEDYTNGFDDDCDGRVDGGALVAEDAAPDWEAALPAGFPLQTVDFNAIAEDEPIASQYAASGVTFTADAGATISGAAMIGAEPAFGVRAAEVDGGVTLAFREHQPAVAFSVIGGSGTLAIEGWVDGERVYTRTVTYAQTLPTTTAFVGLTFEMPVDELRVASNTVAFGIDDLRFATPGLDDADSDGYTERQGDCDDTDAAVSPDLTWYADADGDGHGVSGVTTRACLQPSGYAATPDDCDDEDSSVHPGAAEVCDAGDADEDCDGASDDADPTVSGATRGTWYADVDADGWGDASRTRASCDTPVGLPEAWVARDGDCATTNPDVHPGATEVCDALDVDEDCDAKADDADDDVDAASQESWYPDSDGDTHGDMHAPPVLACAQPAGRVANDDDCNDLDAAVSPALVWYADTDGDGHGDVDAPVLGCLQPPGAVADGDDCDDGRPDVNPDASEACDPFQLDEDCDGAADDADTDSVPPNRVTRWADGDGDGYGRTDASLASCDPVAGYVDNDDDCADGNPGISPAGAEVCDAANTDEDCDGLAEDADPSVSVATQSAWYADTDADGWGDAARVRVGCDVPSGRPEPWVARAGDCMDSRADVSPDGAEVCDPANVDEDCDGMADDADASVASAGYVAWYADADSDGYGDLDALAAACDAPADHVADSSDCDDSDPDISPETVWYADADGDGLGDATVPQVACVAPVGFVGNGDDCDDTSGLIGAAPTWYADADADGFGDAVHPVVACAQPPGTVSSATDCDDEDADISPLATEVCDAADVDEDCDARVDDADPSVAPGSRATWYADGDSDGYGDATRPAAACAAPDGHVAQAGDCDDARADVSPAGAEVCDAANVDEDCDSAVDDTDPSVASASRTPWYADADGDGWGDTARTVQACDAPTGLPEAWVAASGDCDEQRATIHPGATEVCDAADVDEDCDGAEDDADSDVDPAGYTVWYADTDSDGHGDPVAPRGACDVPGGFVADADDCDDTRADVRPGAVERCDAEDADEDCDGAADDADSDVDPDSRLVQYADLDGDGYGVGTDTVLSCDPASGYASVDGDCDDGDASLSPATRWYLDGDGDSYGDATDSVASCTPVSGHVRDASDCDDGIAAIHPGAVEVCDAADVDEDCDGARDDADGSVNPAGYATWYADVDGDGFGDAASPRAACDVTAGFVSDDTDCDDSDAAVTPDTEWYEDADGDGHGDVLAPWGAPTCTRPTGYVYDADDCEPEDPEVHPDADEVCNGTDDDCDGLADDGDPDVLPASLSTWYADLDGDGFGDAALPDAACVAPEGFVADATDCDDSPATGASVHPGAIEVCDPGDVDQDCDGLAEDGDPDLDLSSRLAWYRDADGDAHGDASIVARACAAPSGHVAHADDCDDTRAAIHPGAGERCDPDDVDEDCDGLRDDADPDVLAAGFSTWYADHDLDGFGDAAVSDAACDAPDGFVADGTDCDDAPATGAGVNPDATERCDAFDVDEDCDGDVDDDDSDVDPATRLTWYADEDGDSYGERLSTRDACAAPSGFVADDRDCDDSPVTGAGVHPGASEVCDAADVDEDCDGMADNADVSASEAGKTVFWADADGDGYGGSTAASFCDRPGGYVATSTDCDDSPATGGSVNPGASEVCDAADVDEDCDGVADNADVSASEAGKTVYWADADGDGYGGSTAASFCDLPSGYAATSTDCDDSPATGGSVNPGASEVCDAADVDEDCDGLADDADADVSSGSRATWYADGDGDGFGDPALTLARCDVPSAYVGNDEDCDDADDAVHPDAVERCDGDDLDEDCDGLADDADVSVDAAGFVDWYRDGDADGYGDAGDTQAACDVPDGHVANDEDCDDTDAASNPDTSWFADADADGFGDAAEELVQCVRPDGYVRVSTDCDDTRVGVHPGATEVCDADARDEDCDGVADDADVDVLPSSRGTWYQDGDADGFGSAIRSVAACVQPSGHVARAQDCDDSRATVHPGAADAPYDGLDADCGGQDDFDADGDGLAPIAYGGTDCDDTSRVIRPGAQDFPYDGIDSDCDGADDYDRDGDGFVVAWYGGVDCDDTDATVGPGAIDPAYDGVDGNCDGADEYDVDGDGWDAVEAGGVDCDDGDATVHPGASDAAGDGVDADCDGTDPVGGTCPDCDGDGHAAGADCDDADPAVHPGASDVPYDGRDADCASDDDYDADHDGVRAAGHGGTDCDDTDAARHPGVASDGCGRGDEDCDGTTDEDCVIVPGDTGSGDTGDTGGTDTGSADTGGADTGGDTGSTADTGTPTTPPTTTEPQAPVEVPRGLRGCATAPGTPTTGLVLAAACLAVSLRRRTPSRRKDVA
ncbi:MAG: hypothetical protein RLZZ299_3172 [Pseudomonadota bacterium]